VSTKDASNVTAKELIAWIRQEQIYVRDKILESTDLITKAALDVYQENLGFLEQDILRLSKGIAQENEGLLRFVEVTSEPI
jgi:hypothetical protein